MTIVTVYGSQFATCLRAPFSLRLLLPLLLIFEYNIQSMDDAGNVAENGEEDIDKKIGSTATLEKDAERW